MVIGAVLLSFVAFVCMGAGLLLTVVPIWGAVFSFGAPALAMVGMILGGRAMSEANKAGQPSGFALASVIMNALAFLPAVVVAMTCGVCNACVSAGGLQPGSTQQIQWMLPQQGLQPRFRDAGAPPPPFRDEPDPGPSTPDEAAPQDSPDTKPTDTPEPAEAKRPTPRSTLPPPPLAPGPTR